MWMHLGVESNDIARNQEESEKGGEERQVSRRGGGS